MGVRLADRLETLRDDLVMHFVHEEEALFPYLSAAVPTLAPAISDLLALHDEICATVARLVHLAESPARIAGLVPVFDRFQVAYTKHTHGELVLFEQAATHLTRDQRLELTALVKGL